MTSQNQLWHSTKLEIVIVKKTIFEKKNSDKKPASDYKSLVQRIVFFLTSDKKASKFSTSEN